MSSMQEGDNSSIENELFDGGRRSVRQTYYDILGVTPTDSKVKIRDVYIRLKKTYGSTSQALYSIMEEDVARDTLAEIEQAFHVLDDEVSRRKYDEEMGFAVRNVDKFGSYSYGKGLQGSAGVSREISMADSVVDYDVSSTGVTDSGNGIFGDLERVGEPVYVRKSTPIKKVADAAGNETVKNEVAGLIEAHDAGDGTLYRKIRELMGLSLEQVHVHTRVMANYLQAIEENNYAILPAVVYIRGFLRSYLLYLGLNPVDTYVNRYLEMYTSWTKKIPK